MTQEECPFRSGRALHDDKGEFHLCNREGGDCECIPSGCPYLIAKNSKLNLPDLPGYVQIDNEQGVCKDSLHIPETCKENAESFTILEEAARLYADNQIPTDYPDYFCRQDLQAAFIAGAKWHEQQMMKEAVEGEIQMRYSGCLCAKTIRAINEDKFKLGDKVRIIIVKEEK